MRRKPSLPPFRFQVWILENLDSYRTRRERLQARLKAQRLVGLLVTNLTNIFYLTGFRGSAGVALVTLDESLLWVDPRYTLQAREQVQGLEVVEVKGKILQEVVRWVRRALLDRVGYDDSSLTCREFAYLESGKSSKPRWVPAGGVIEDLRVVKDSEEIDSIRQAGRLTTEVFDEVRSQVRPGIRERDLAVEIEYRMKRKGAEGAAFETIVASGRRSAWPHARPSSKLLEKNELVIVDLGAILRGYAADMTRTLYLGTPGREVRRIYDAVHSVQQRVITACRGGRPAGDLDALARRALQRKKLAAHFTHSTGHGVGLEIHENPRLGRGVRTRLRNGCVITVEPGVYLESWGGIRIEDTVLVTKGTPEVLTPWANEVWYTG